MEKKLSKSRVLWITERHPPQEGGMAVSSGRQVAGLRRINTGLDLLFLTGAAPAEPIRFDDRDNGADILIPGHPSPGITAQLALAQVSPRHAREPYTFVVGFGAGLPGFMAVTFAAWLSLPSLVMVRGNDFDRDLFDPRRGLWVRESLARATVIGCVSSEKAARVRALFPGADARVTPNGIEPAAFDLLPRDKTKRDEVRAKLSISGGRVIGLFGEIKFKKRVPLFLGALRDAGLNEKAAVLAVGRLDEETAQILGDPAISPRYLVLPFCRRDEIAGLYAACDFIALPSLAEGMPNVLLEAMALGVVPIASDAGAMPEVIEDGRTGFLFPAENRRGAAEAVKRAFALSASELQDMSERAREKVRTDFTVEREIDVLSSILTGRGHARG